MSDPVLPLSEEDLTEIDGRARQDPDAIGALRLRRDVERLLIEIYRLRGLLGNRVEWIR
jgi:hypothetical protein